MITLKELNTNKKYRSLSIEKLARLIDGYRFTFVDYSKLPGEGPIGKAENLKKKWRHEMIRRKNILPAVICFIIAIFGTWWMAENVYPQTPTVTLEFTWTNTNTTTVGFDIMEVYAPPDTNRMCFYVNSTAGLLPNCAGDCSFETIAQADNKVHYYRMSAYDARAGKESPWSNVASCLLPISGTTAPPVQSGLTAPINFKVVVKKQ